MRVELLRQSKIDGSTSSAGTYDTLHQAWDAAQAECQMILPRPQVFAFFSMESRLERGESAYLFTSMEHHYSVIKAAE